MSFQFLDNGQPLYMRVYNYYKDMISKGTLTSGQKLPSIRRCSEELNISCTTVENAYMSLMADGYIFSKKNSGYYVSDLLLPEKFTKTVQGAKTEAPVIADKVLVEIESTYGDKTAKIFEVRIY